VAVALAAGFLMAAAVPSSSTVVAPLDLAELVAGARTIVYGRVMRTQAVVVDGRTETTVSLGVPAYFKGDGGREVVFRVPGGQIGRYRTVVVGAPVLQPGDEVVVFLRGDRAAMPVIVGFSQGVLRVVRPAPGATPMVLAPPFARDGGAQGVKRGTGARRFVPLADFAADVRAMAADIEDGTARNGRVPAIGRVGER
jgi:hypothetical protein